MDKQTLGVMFQLASFAITTWIFVAIVRRTNPKKKLYWYAACSVIAIVWLGVIYGSVAVAITVLITSGYVATRLDARKQGNQIADSIGISRNLFYSCLENSLPLYLDVLAGSYRDGISAAAMRSTLLPYLVNGMDVLEQRFGRQPMIDDARIRIRPLIDEPERQVR
jgi:hypothetical protein